MAKPHRRSIHSRRWLPRGLAVLALCGAFAGCSIFSKKSKSGPASQSVPAGKPPAKAPVALTESLKGEASSDEAVFRPKPYDLSARSFTCTQDVFPRERIWRLSQAQVRNVLRDVGGIEASSLELAALADSAGLYFHNESAMQRLRKSDMTSWWITAEALAKKLVEPGKPLAPKCAAADSSCWDAYVESTHLALGRRPVPADAKDEYRNILVVHASASPGTRAAAVARSILASPSFLYRSELGEPVKDKPKLRRLDAYEAASMLSFTLWETAPDAELMRAAKAGELSSTAGLRKQAQRMANDTRLARSYAALVEGLTESSEIATMPTVTERANGAALAAAYESELEAFVVAVLADPKPTLATLMTRERLPVLAFDPSFRAVPRADDKEVSLPEHVAAGIFALGGISLAGANGALPSPVRRGKIVVERFFCSTLPPPPDGVDTDVIDPGTTKVKTNRELYEAATMAKPACAACHVRFNSLGYAFEAFDHLGRLRADDMGAPLDLHGSTKVLREGNFDFEDLAGLASGIAASEQGTQCFALNAFRHAAGRVESEGDGCSLERVSAAFEKGGKDLRALAVELASQEQSLYRSGE